MYYKGMNISLHILITLTHILINLKKKKPLWKCIILMFGDEKKLVTFKC